MVNIEIRLIEGGGDLEAVRNLCREWLDWHWDNYPADWPTEGNPMDPERFEGILTNLSELHARPLGAIILALIDDQPAGCVMYNLLDQGVAEFNRMYVSESGRGHGLGHKMLEHMFRQMKADGYNKVVFSSAIFLTHARKMYEKAGFISAPHPDGFPEDWRDKVYFMERAL